MVLSTNKCDHWKLPSPIWSARLRNGEKEVQIVYVKLGINSERLEIYPPEVTCYALKNWSALSGTNWTQGMTLKCETDGLLKQCPFPVEATWDQSYTPEEFRAYRLLGKWMAEQALPHLKMLPQTNNKMGRSGGNSDQLGFIGQTRASISPDCF